MTSPQLSPVVVEPPRDRWQRPLIIPPGGGKPVAYTRCTTFVSALEDGHNIGDWKRRMAVAGIAQRPDLHLRAVSLGPAPQEDGTAEATAAAKRWKREMNTLAEQAGEAAASSAAATIGTSLHAFTEQIDKGQELNWATVPDRYRDHLTNYQRATAAMRVVGVERFVVNDELQIGGTADRFVTVDGHEGLFVADLKTGSVEYGAGKIAMQLATYAHSVKYNPADGSREVLPGIRHDRGIVVHLDAKTGLCRLLWVDLAAAWPAVAAAGWVREWRKRKNLMVPAEDLAGSPVLPGSDPAPTPAPLIAPDPAAAATAAAVDAAIRSAATRDDLQALWAEAQARGLWSDALTEAAKARLNQLDATA